MTTALSQDLIGKIEDAPTILPEGKFLAHVLRQNGLDYSAASDMKVIDDAYARIFPPEAGKVVLYRGHYINDSGELEDLLSGKRKIESWGMRNFRSELRRRKQNSKLHDSTTTDEIRLLLDEYWKKIGKGEEDELFDHAMEASNYNRSRHISVTYHASIAKEFTERYPWSSYVIRLQVSPSRIIQRNSPHGSVEREVFLKYSIEPEEIDALFRIGFSGRKFGETEVVEIMRIK